MPLIADFTDAELASAIHFIDARVEDLDPQELRAWRIMSEMIKERAQAHRDIEADDAGANDAADRWAASGGTNPRPQ